MRGEVEIAQAARVFAEYMQSWENCPEEKKYDIRPKALPNEAGTFYPKDKAIALSEARFACVKVLDEAWKDEKTNDNVQGWAWLISYGILKAWQAGAEDKTEY